MKDALDERMKTNLHVEGRPSFCPIKKGESCFMVVSCIECIKEHVDLNVKGA